MIDLSWEYEFKGAKANWFVGGIFTVVAIFLAFILPLILQPSIPENPITVTGVVTELQSDGDMFHPVVAYTVNGKQQQYVSSIGSSRPAFKKGDQPELIVNAQAPEQAILKADPDLAAAISVLRILAFVFGAIGLTVLMLMIKGVDEKVVSRIGGLLGALSFGIPATLAYPLLYLAFLSRPNFLFAQSDPFDIGPWYIMVIFTVLGVITTVGTLVLYRYQAKTGKDGWSWSWQSK